MFSEVLAVSAPNVDLALYLYMRHPSVVVPLITVSRIICISGVCAEEGRVILFTKEHFSLE